MASLTDDVSDKADWIILLTAHDDESDTDIDFTGAEIAVAISDPRGCQYLTADLTSGVTLLSPTVIQIAFKPEQTKQLPPGQYKIGAVYRLNGFTEQLFVAEFTVYDGVASL